MIERWLMGGGLSRTVHRTGPTVVAIVVIAAIAYLLAGCGATAAQQHRDLNTLTDIADPTYESALQACDAARDLVVAREGSTREQDFRDMGRINEVCDAIVFGFESLRGSQLTARAAIDNGVPAATATVLQEGIAAWQRLQAMVPELRGITDVGAARAGGGAQ